MEDFEMRMKLLTDLFRAIARPMISVIFAIIIAIVVVEGITAPTWFLGMAGTAIAWYFVDRTVLHKKEQAADKDVQTAIIKELLGRLNINIGDQSK